MFFLRNTFAAALTAVFFAPVFAAETAEQQFVAIALSSPEGIKAKAGELLEVDIDLAASGGLAVESSGERIVVLYRMAFNQIAEGWSWQPLSDPAHDDYYRFKFLPLQSVADERGEYTGEDKIGTPQQMKVSWRYDYFLAFENLYDFYPRAVDDDAGFSASLPVAMAGRVGMRARARLIAPVISESTTFWKATYGKPTDFTLKKRYLVSRLEEIDFVDAASGAVLCRILPGQGRCIGQ
jgi:hypothetical protein